MEFTLSAVLFCVGLYAVVTKKSLVKIIIGLAVMGYAVNLFIILAGYGMNSAIPILSSGWPHAKGADALAQAVVLAAVILELSVTLLLTALALKLREKYGTFDIGEIKKLKG